MKPTIPTITPISTLLFLPPPLCGAGTGVGSALWPEVIRGRMIVRTAKASCQTGSSRCLGCPCRVAILRTTSANARRVRAPAARHSRSKIWPGSSTSPPTLSLWRSGAISGGRVPSFSRDALLRHQTDVALIERRNVRHPGVARTRIT